MKAAYKQADERKIDNQQVLVDVERGRTVPNWRPRRLGGGLGATRIGSEDANQRPPGREHVQSGEISRSKEPRGERDRNYGGVDTEDSCRWPHQPEHGHGRPETEHDRGRGEYYGTGRHHSVCRRLLIERAEQFASE